MDNKSAQEKLISLVKQYKDSSQSWAAKKINREFWKLLKQSTGIRTAFLDRDLELSRYGLHLNTFSAKEFVNSLMAEEQQQKERTTMNEEILNNLLNSVKSGSPLDFSQSLDTALKYKCAEAIDSRKTELAASFGLKEDQGESMPPEDEEENFEGDPGDTKKVDNEDDEFVNEEESDDTKKDKETFSKWGPVKKGPVIKPTNIKVTPRPAG